MTANQNLAPQRSNAPFREVHFAPVDIKVQSRADGAIVVSNRLPLPELPVRQLADYLRRHASQRPDHTWLAQPDGQGGWQRLSYAEARRRVDGLSQWLINLGLPAGQPIMVLSDNSINHALLQLAAMQVGVAVMPVSVAYSLVSPECERVADLIKRFKPAMVYADNPQRYGNALRVVSGLCPAIRVADSAAEGLVDAVLPEHFNTPLTPQLQARYQEVGPDHTARLLLTSGSTGSPKAVIMSQRNILASGLLWDTVWPFLAEQPLRIVDWLPWSHTAGAHGPFSMCLRHGGTLYLSDGKPVPGQIDRFVAHLREVQPNVMVNVPRGLDMLVAAIENKPEAVKDIFTRLEVIVYGGAALATPTLYKLEALSAAATGRRVPVSASLGSTETTMPATLIWWPPHTAGTIGLPAPGVEAKLVPDGDRFEVRFRGATITRGYYQDDKANQTTFDDEGYLKTGDAVAWANPQKPQLGLIYAGRMAENFKLNTGTWVSVANVRSALLEHLPEGCVADVVLAAPNQAELGVLLFINFDEARKRLPDCAGCSDQELATHPKLLQAIANSIKQYNQAYPRTSTRIARALLLSTPPNVAAGEITDKGHVNQRAVLALRAEAVQRLYLATESGHDCLLFNPSS